MEGSEPEPLIRNRNFLILWSGQAVSALGSRISRIAFPLLVLAITRSPAAAGLAGFANGVPFVLVGLLAGGMVDRVDRKRIMVLCDAGRCIALASIAVALWLGSLTLVQILVVAFVEGSLAIFFSVAETSALPQIVTNRQVSFALAQNEARAQAASLIGQPLGGLLFGIGMALPFVADSVSYAASVVSLLFVRARFQQERTEPRGRILKELAEGVAWLWRQPLLRAMVLVVAAGNILVPGVSLTVIVLAKREGAPSSLIGLIFGVVGVGALIGAILTPLIQRRFSPTTILIAANWVWAALTPLLILAPHPLVLGVIFGLMWILLPAWDVVIDAYILRVTPDRLRGRINSLGLLVAWGALPLGSILSGVMNQWIGPISTTIVFAVMSFGLALTCSVSKTIRHAPVLSTQL